MELQGTIKVLPPPYTQPDPTPFLQITNIGSAGVQQGIYRHRARPELRDQPLLLRLLHRRFAEPRPAVALHRQRRRSPARSPAASSSSTRIREDANAEHHGGARQVRQRRQALLHHRRALQRARRRRTLNSPRGKIHRINPDGTVPTDNPFYDGTGPNCGLDLGATGCATRSAPTTTRRPVGMFIGDVGGNDHSTAKEEVNIGARGANYGWPNCEGNCSGAVHEPALLATPHNGRDAAITGGFVYHGTPVPAPRTRAATSSPTTRRTGSGA